MPKHLSSSIQIETFGWKKDADDGAIKLSRLRLIGSFFYQLNFMDKISHVLQEDESDNIFIHSAQFADLSKYHALIYFLRILLKHKTSPPDILLDTISDVPTHFIDVNST